MFAGLLQRGTLKNSIAVTSLLKAAHVALSFVIGVVLARGLGPDQYGRWAFALALVALLSIPAQLGLPNLVVRETARYRLQGAWGKVRGLLRRADQVALAVNASLMLLAGGLIMWTGQAPTGNTALYGWALLMVPLTTFTDLRAAALRGLHRPASAQLAEHLLRPLLFLGAIAVALALHTLSPESAMALNVLAAAGALLLASRLLTDRSPSELEHARPEYETTHWRRSVLPLTLISAMTLANHQIDLILLGVLTTSVEVGIYRVATQGAMLVAFTLTTINLVLAPQISRLHFGGEQAELQRLVTRAARTTLLSALPLAALLMAFGEPILATVFGEAYAGGRTALAILCMGQLANAAMGPVGNLLNMTGHPGDTARGFAIGAASNIALNIALIPSFGIEGAAAATAASVTLWNLLLNLQARRRLGINSSAFALTGRLAAQPRGARS